MTAEGVDVWGSPAVVAPAVTSAGQIFRLVQTTKYANTIACLNVFYFATDTSGNSASSLASDWGLNLKPTWQANVHSNISFLEVTAQEIHPTEGPIMSVALAGNGSKVSTCAPVVCAGVLTWRTAAIGKTKRGRSFIAGMEYLPGTTTDGYRWISAGITALNNIGNAIITRYQLGGNPVGFYLVVWSRKIYNQNPSAWQNAATMVTRFTSQPYIATMGSRRYGRGM